MSIIIVLLLLALCILFGIPYVYCQIRKYLNSKKEYISCKISSNISNILYEAKYRFSYAGHPPHSNVLNAIIETPLWTIFYFFMSAYIINGLIFAIFYSILLPSESNWPLEKILHFSYTSQVTGVFIESNKYMPVILLSGFQTFLGVSLQAVTLGIIVYKLLLKRPHISFSDFLVYHPKDGFFTFAYRNHDIDKAKDIKVLMTTLRTIKQGTHTEEYMLKINLEKELISEIEPHIPYVLETHRIPKNFKKSSSKITTFKSDPQKAYKNGIHLLPHEMNDIGHVNVSITGLDSKTGTLFESQKIYSIENMICGVLTTKLDDIIELQNRRLPINKYRNELIEIFKNEYEVDRTAHSCKDCYNSPNKKQCPLSEKK
jgi:hypothetical protein